MSKEKRERGATSNKKVDSHERKQKRSTSTVAERNNSRNEVVMIDSEEEEEFTQGSGNNVLNLWGNDDEDTATKAKECVMSCKGSSSNLRSGDRAAVTDGDSSESESQSPVARKKVSRLKRLKKRAVDKYIERDAEEEIDNDTGVAWTDDEEDSDAESLPNNYDAEDPFIDDATDWDENELESQYGGDKGGHRGRSWNRHEMRQRSVLSQADEKRPPKSLFRCGKSASLPTVERVMEQVNRISSRPVDTQSSLDTDAEVEDLNSGTDEEVEREARLGDESDNSDAHSFVVNDMGEDGESYMFSNGSTQCTHLTPEGPCCAGCEDNGRNFRMYVCKTCQDVFLCEACQRYRNVLHGEEGHFFQLYRENSNDQREYPDMDLNCSRYKPPSDSPRGNTSWNSARLAAEKPLDLDRRQVPANTRAEDTTSDNGSERPQEGTMEASVQKTGDKSSSVKNEELKERIRRNKEAAKRRLQARRQNAATPVISSSKESMPNGVVSETPSTRNQVPVAEACTVESFAGREGDIPWDAVIKDFNLLGEASSDSEDEEVKSAKANTPTKLLVGQKRGTHAVEFRDNFQAAMEHLGSNYSEHKFEVYESPLNGNVICFQDLSYAVVLGLEEVDETTIKSLLDDLQGSRSSIKALILYGKADPAVKERKITSVRKILNIQHGVTSCGDLQEALQAVLQEAVKASTNSLTRIPWSPSYRLQCGSCEHISDAKDRNARIAKARLLMRKHQLSPVESIAVVETIGNAKLGEAVPSLNAKHLVDAAGITHDSAERICSKIQKV
eukprot:gb/GECG01014948.1/.p1 GENE.gb/GECG01014948.1/~~gb/GECG01014948.1/.p1  ORF type:complete len:786 (+),score=134.98 gb/GECG01014948.1/:1-2358(+)